MGIKVSKWRNYQDDSRADLISNPYYKSFTNSFITDIEVWPSATGRISTHYSITEGLPWYFNGDFTIVLNPFKEELKKNDGSTSAIGLVVQMQVGFGNTPMRYETKWAHGNTIMSYLGNVDAGDELDEQQIRVVVDGDDAISPNSVASQEIMGMDNNDRTEVQNMSNGYGGVTGSLASIGTMKATHMRFACGLADVSSVYQMHITKNKFSILIIPHKARGSYIT